MQGISAFRMACMLGLAISIPTATNAQTVTQTAIAPVVPAAAPVVPVTPPPVDPHAIFAGSPFTFVGGDHDRLAVEAAIDRVTADLFFAFRGLARSRLRALNPLYPLAAVHFTNGQIEVVLFGQPPFRSPENGTRAPWSSDNGDTFQLAQRFENGRVVQEIYGPGGMRRNELVVSPDGHNLVLRVRITASQLPRPLEYTLSYHR